MLTGSLFAQSFVENNQRKVHLQGYCDDGAILLQRLQMDLTAVLTSPAGLLPVLRRDCLEMGDDLCSPRRSRDLLHLVLFGTPNGYLLEVCSLMFTS